VAAEPIGKIDIPGDCMDAQVTLPSVEAESCPHLLQQVAMVLQRYKLNKLREVLTRKSSEAAAYFAQIASSSRFRVAPSDVLQLVLGAVCS